MDCIALLPALFASMSDALIVCDERLVIAQINPAAEAMAGCANAAAAGRPACEFLGQLELRPVDSKAIGEALAGRQRLDRHAASLGVAGAAREALVSVLPLAADAMGCSGVAIVLSSVHYTQNVSQEWPALRESEARFRTIFEGSSLGIGLTDLAGRIFVSNPALEAMLGYSAQELLGVSYSEFTHPDDQARERLLVQELFAGQRDNCQLDKRYLRKDGMVVWGRLNIRLVRNQSGQPCYLVGMVEDLTYRKRLEEQLVQAQKLEALGRLAGSIAHDFNNVLSPILGYSDMLRNCLAHDPEGLDYVNEILAATERARDMVRQIRIYCRDREEKLEPVRFQELVIEALRFLRSTLSPSVELRQRFNAPDAQIMAAPTQLHQVITNLFTYAWHAMESEGGVLTVTLDEVIIDRDEPSTDSKAGPWLRLEIHDSGCGVEQTTPTRIFEPFSTYTANEDTGLSLAIAHGIIERLGGIMRIACESGRGACFQVDLPRCLAAPNASPPPASGQLPPTGRARVLLVDDEPPFANLGRRIIEKLGHEVIVLTDSRQALEILRQRPGDIDLLLTDQSMPGLNGLDLAREALRLQPDLPVIIFSGNGDNLAADARLMGVSAVLAKPLRVGELTRALAAALNRRMRPNSLYDNTL